VSFPTWILSTIHVAIFQAEGFRKRRWPSKNHLADVTRLGPAAVMATSTWTLRRIQRICATPTSDIRL